MGILASAMPTRPAGPSAACLLVLPLACLLAAAAEAAELSAVLFDTEVTQVTREGPGDLSPTELRIVPPALGVAASRDACEPTDVHWLTPRTPSRARGSFTRRGADQVIVSVRLRRCDDVEESPLPGALVLYDADAVVATLARRANVLVVSDVDGDGLEEVVIVTDEVGLGAFQRYASLWGFAQGEPRLLVDFGEVSADYCGSYILYDEPVTHSRVTYVPDDGAPTFDVVRRAAPCRY